MNRTLVYILPVFFLLLVNTKLHSQSLGKLNLKVGGGYGIPHERHVNYIRPDLSESRGRINRPISEADFNYSDSYGFMTGVDYYPFNFELFEDVIKLSLLTGVTLFGHNVSYHYEGIYGYYLENDLHTGELKGEYNFSSLRAAAQLGFNLEINPKNHRYSYSFLTSINFNGERFYSRSYLIYENHKHKTVNSNEIEPISWREHPGVFPLLNIELHISHNDMFGFFAGVQIPSVIGRESMKTYFELNAISHYNYFSLGLTYKLLAHEK